MVEFARNVLGLAGANSTEFDSATPAPVVVFMPEGSTSHKGGTMRLGSRRTLLETVDCITAKLYQVGMLSHAYMGPKYGVQYIPTHGHIQHIKHTLANLEANAKDIRMLAT